jgi:glycosyltransferase involved in cell wall biosynthesis
MKFLFITTGVPQHSCGSGERSLSIRRALERHGLVRVLFLSYPWSYKDDHGADYEINLMPRELSARTYYRRQFYLMEEFRVDRRLAEAVAAIHRQESFSGFMCRPFMANRCGAHRLGPSWLDLDGLPTEFMLRPVPGFGYLRARHLDWSIRAHRAVFVTKPSDARKIKHPNVRVLPCISTQTSPSSTGAAPRERPIMLFVGRGRADENREGLVRFVKSSLPQIRAVVPTAVLKVVGAGWESLAGIDGVELCGFVPDLPAAYDAAGLVVCPIWRGVGSTVKLAEAVQAAKAVVASSYAAAGYEGMLKPGRDLFVGGSDDELALACIQILTDPAQRRRLEDSAAAAARRELGQETVNRIIDAALGLSQGTDDST